MINLKKHQKNEGLKLIKKFYIINLNSIYKEPDKHIDIIKQIMNS